MRRILCAVDFSEASHEALDVAVELARRWDAVLVLVHVDDLPLWIDEPYFHLPGDVTAAVVAEAGRTLDAWKREARDRGVAEVEARLASGVPWERIVAIAREDPRIDHIVVGTHGRAGLRRAMIGSVAERVVRHAPCAVTVVRHRD